MDMAGMLMGQGMDMSSDGMFRTFNQQLAEGYWYIIAFVVAVLMAIRAVDYYQTWSRLRICRTRRSTTYPTKVNNLAMQAYATATAVIREMSYPRYHFGGIFSWLSPPQLGRVWIIACYWAIIAYMMFYKSFVNDAYYWERVGFRGAWISVTQVPFIYLLSSKANIIGYLIGTSHERLNWLHRWVSRTLLVTVTIHGSFFLREWVRADFVELELAMMPMVKYGIGAWAVLVWTFISSISPLRRVAYEFFVMQHIAGAAVLLWLLWVHVPSYAQYNVWFAIGAVCFDWALRLVLLIYKNFTLRAPRTCNGGQKIGHQVDLQAVGSDLTIVTIKDVHMSWKPGQHVYLWLPQLGPLESHPFTIASPYDTSNQCHCNEIQLAVQAHSGISKRMRQFAVKNQGLANKSLTGFIAGPYGVPPSWQAYESLILISASTGASFTLPILESLLSNSATICTQRIYFLLVVRDRHHIAYYEERLSQALARAESRGIHLEVEIAITSETSSLPDSDKADEKSSLDSSEAITETDDAQTKKIYPVVVKTTSAASSTTDSQPANAKTSHAKQSKCCCANNAAEDEAPAASSCCCAGPAIAASRPISYSYCRPDIAAYIRRPVELTGGETSVAVCGGKSLVASVSNAVASLSDERAVHKGSGAQGIRLYVEEYCF